MFVITGATGNIGGKIAEKLLDQGKKVRALGRSAKRMEGLRAKGAEVVEVDVMDTAGLTRAFQGATAVFALIPPHMQAPNMRSYQNEVGQSLTTAIREAKVSHVINLSSIGAHLPQGTGVVAGLYDQEQRLNGLEGVHVLHLRPTFFMENLMMQVGTIKAMGIMGSPLRGDLAVPQIATQDIADYAVKRFLKLDFSGKVVQELLGQRNVSMNEAATILGKAIGKPDLQYVQFPYEDATKAMVGMGMSPDGASGLVELNKAFNEGLAKPTQARTAENTTPTTMEQFAQVFAAVYRS